jgi:phosphatidylserine decarboxylase
MFHKEGTKTILFMIFTAAVLLLSDYFIATMWLKLLQIGALILVIILQFFRNPKRIFTTNENQISPVDGKVVVIEEVYEYYKDKRLQISIFMSPYVHVTRYAISGIVKFSKYHPGKFLVAWHPKASEENELPSSLKTIRLVYFIPSSCRCISP